MNDINKYEYAVKAIRQAVEKSRYRATKAGNADSTIRQPMAGEINWNEFISLGFTHHIVDESCKV